MWLKVGQILKKTTQQQVLKPENMENFKIQFKFNVLAILVSVE